MQTLHLLIFSTHFLHSGLQALAVAYPSCHSVEGGPHYEKGASFKKHTDNGHSYFSHYVTHINNVFSGNSMASCFVTSAARSLLPFHDLLPIEGWHSRSYVAQVNSYAD